MIEAEDLSRAQSMRDAASWLNHDYFCDENADPPHFTLLPPSSSSSSSFVRIQHLHEVQTAGMRLAAQRRLAPASALELSAHFLVTELLLAGAASREARPTLGAPIHVNAKAIPPPRGPRHPAILVTRTFDGRPALPEVDTALDALVGALPKDALMRLKTPWRANGLLDPRQLGAHRAYLRKLADGLASKLADALIEDAATPTPIPSAFEDELAAHMGRAEGCISQCFELLQGEESLRRAISFLSGPLKAIEKTEPKKRRGAVRRSVCDTPAL